MYSQIGAEIMRGNKHIVIRLFEAADAAPIEALLRTLWAHDPTMLALYQGMHRDWQTEALIRRTLVAVVDGGVVGAGTIFESTIHPRMLMVTINVAASWQRQGIGTQVYRALESLGDGRPWFVKATRRDHAAMAFLHQHGFRPVIGTRMGLLDPRHVAVHDWIAALPSAIPDYQVLRFDDPRSTASLADIALVHAAIYRQSHGWNPPVVEQVAESVARYCGPNVIAGSHICVYHQNRIVGAANMIANPFQPDPAEAYLVNIGVVELSDPDARNVTGMLIRRSLEFAADHRLYVRFEADDTHQPFQSLLMNAPATAVDHDFVIMTNEHRA